MENDIPIYILTYIGSYISIVLFYYYRCSLYVIHSNEARVVFCEVKKVFYKTFKPYFLNYTFSNFLF